MSWINPRKLPVKNPRNEGKGELYDPTGVVCTYRGKTMGLREWARHPSCKTTVPSMRRRLAAGWDFSEALTTPTGERNPKGMK